MSEVVERVARAIFAEYHRQGVNHDDFDLLMPSIQESLRMVARAAIEAMREPSEAMVAAGDELEPVFEHADAIYTAMITEALK